MPANFRRFQAGPDPFNRTWEVEFRWLQTGISIRHADTVDVKFVVWTEGEEKQEKIIALPHPMLLALAAKIRTCAHRRMVPETRRPPFDAHDYIRRGPGEDSGYRVQRGSGERRRSGTARIAALRGEVMVNIVLGTG